MPLYLLLSPVRQNRERIEAGEFVELDVRDGDEFVERGIAELAEEADAASPPRGNVEKLAEIADALRPADGQRPPLPTAVDLAKFNKAKLIAQAEAEGVSIDATATNKSIAGVIIAARGKAAQL